jgi:hypothetical protein
MRAADAAAMERLKKRLQDEKTGFSEFAQGKRRIGGKKKKQRMGWETAMCAVHQVPGANVCRQ